MQGYAKKNCIRIIVVNAKAGVSTNDVKRSFVEVMAENFPSVGK